MELIAFLGVEQYASSCRAMLSTMQSIALVIEEHSYSTSKA